MIQSHSAKKTQMRIIVRIVGLLVLIASCQSASAQLFGPRNVGRNARGNQVVDTATAGTVTANRRFVRGSRSSDNFVGADRTESRVFVGNTQATNDGDVTTSVETLREQPVARVNRSATASVRGMYRPRLTIAFGSSDGNPAGPGDVNSVPPLSTSLTELSSEFGIHVSHVPRARTATLTGTVPTEHHRRIAELLVLFEPGVETVENDLQVAN